MLVGAYSDALDTLSTQLATDPKDGWLRFTLATCLLHMERYQEAVAAYEQAIAEASCLWCDDKGLKAARLGRQPDWAKL